MKGGRGMKSRESCREDRDIQRGSVEGKGGGREGMGKG